MEAWTYIRNFLRDPNIASIAPTSGFGIDRLTSHMNFGDAKAIVEYGPATGVITEELLRRMPQDGQLLAIDTNESFLKILAERLPDRRLSIAHDSAENVDRLLAGKGLKGANYVISGIPFTMLPPDVAERIVQKTYDALVPGGKFLVYQFLKPETEKSKGIHRYLPLAFKKISREIELRNLPPLRIHIAEKE